LLHNPKIRKIGVIFIAAVIFVICVGFGSYKYNKAQAYSNLISAANKDMDNGEYDQAIALFKQALNYKSDPMIQKNIKLAASLKEAKNIYDDGVKLMNDKKYSDAIEKFNKITKEDDKLYDNAQKNIDKCKSELSKKEKGDSTTNANTNTS